MVYAYLCMLTNKKYLVFQNKKGPVATLLLHLNAHVLLECLDWMLWIFISESTLILYRYSVWKSTCTIQCTSTHTCQQLCDVSLGTMRHTELLQHGSERPFTSTERREGRQNWKGCGDAASAELCTCPAGCVTRHEAFADTRTPLPSGWLHTDGLSGYFRRLHYSSEQTHAGKVLVFGLHTCAQHSRTGRWTRKETIKKYCALQKPDKERQVWF